MTIVRHELRQGRAALAVWTASVACLLSLCILLYPSMKGQMDAAGKMFAQMGDFAAAFGMDRLELGTLAGYYAVECGAILGLGGAFFAALLGAASLAKEERDHTAELLLTHPVSRPRIVSEKLAAVLVQLAVMNAVLFALALLSIRLTGEEFPWRELLLLHGSHCLLQIELACVCFGVSAFLRRGGAGIGIGLAAGLYFLELLANISEQAKFLKYVTPFAYCEGADILAAGRLDTALVLPGLCYAAIGIAAAYWRYTTKDIA